MLLAIQILLGVLFAGTGIGLVVDIGKNRMDELKVLQVRRGGFLFFFFDANLLCFLGWGSFAPPKLFFTIF